jgi:hypothetical protein
MSNELVDQAELLKIQLARQAAAIGQLRTTGSFITFKNANLKVDGAPIPSNSIEVRVLAVVAERAWYADAYDADVAQVPACYSLNATGVPHEQSSLPQNATCQGCPKDKWGSAPPRPGANKPGRGKACREGARVIVVPAGMPVKVAPLYQAKVPVTSLDTVASFVSRCTQSNKLTGEFVTHLSVTEDNKSFFKVHLNIKELSSDLELETLLKRQDEARDLALQPYPDIGE